MTHQVLTEYDHADNRLARVVALRRAMAKGEDDDPALLRAEHVTVWREFGLIQGVFEGVWNTPKLQSYRRYLASRGLTWEDVDDVVQSIALHTFTNFEKWLPWRAAFWTWASWRGRRTLSDLFRDKGRKVLRLDEELLEETVEDRYLPPQPASVVVDKVIGMLRSRFKETYDSKLLDAVELLEHALQLGDDFSGFSTVDFAEASGMSRGQVAYRFNEVNIRDLFTTAIADVYEIADEVLLVGRP